ncbi:uncharacterized protein LOC114542773 [Dendronephthya gigantea]|uniref:uncharacterized protein LOC114542773 n=1 Tax=Dendronephthya gigantea TaxID=151771 RepID=UPI00106DCAB4|nr:uncharacterized protein LOC114542773 [Dendronephthya gigantea]
MLEEGDQDFKVNEHDLINYPREWQICVRRKNLEDETSEKMGRNLYAILKLDMKDVRKQSPEEQDKMIRKAYHKQMLIFHPDHNPNADNHICQEIIMAYSILGDREKRASYHLTDYSGGWLSKSRWKAIFKPEAHGRHEGLKRVGLLLFSAVCVVGGVAITVLTGGLGLPILIVGNIIAGGLIGGSIQGAFRTISYDSIKNGVELKKYAKSFGIGAALGAIGGIATAGVTMAIIGTGNTAVAIAEAAVSDLIASGAASGSINGALASVSNDMDSILVDGKKKKLAHIGKNALAGAAIGAGVKMIGVGCLKLVAKLKFVEKVEGEAIEKTWDEATAETVNDVFVSSVCSSMCQSVEQPSFFSSDAPKNAENTPQSDSESAPESDSETAPESDSESAPESDSVSAPESFYFYSESAPESDSESAPESDSVSAPKSDSENAPESDSESAPEREDVELRYICKEAWFSRMVVEHSGETFYRDGGNSIMKIPRNTSKVKVRFQVMRGPKIWCDVKKYNREKKCWCKPTVPHIFNFDVPITYTFTLEGSLYFEAVMKVTDQHYHEVNIME